MMQQMRAGLICIFLVLAAGAVHAETLTSPLLGFRIEMPVGWRLLSISERAVANEDWHFGSDELDRLVKSTERTSLLAIVVRDQNNPRVNPGIYLNYYEGSISDIGAALDRMAAWIAEHAQEPRFSEKGSLTTIGAFKAGRLEYSYEIEGGDLKLRVSEIMWLVPLKEGYLIIAGGVEEGRDSDATGDIVDAVRSLRRL